MGKRRTNRRDDAGEEPSLPVIPIEIELTEPALELVDDLQSFGIFGLDRKEVVERLVYRALQEMTVEHDFFGDDDDD